MSDQWRVLVTFQYQEDAERVLRHLHDAGEVRNAGGTISMPADEPAIWVYAPDSTATGTIGAALRNGAVAVGVKPLSVRSDKWLPGEMRWSTDRRRGIGSDWDLFDFLISLGSF